MPQIKWSPSALNDLERLLSFLKSRNVQAAQRAVQAIRQAAVSLQEFPQRGLQVKKGSNQRKLKVSFGKQGYVIYYFIEDDTVVIVRIYHGRENRPR
ncbi:MAG: type II toxin-antitoxin system RelE/ParE family toxin [Cyanobacteriota bacterium]|nr:type II toxin-antitoxin system RelE/ParE family toxin [Cyanobacteriota bacterium]